MIDAKNRIDAVRIVSWRRAIKAGHDSATAELYGDCSVGALRAGHSAHRALEIARHYHPESNNMTHVKFSIYSAKQAELVGTSIYLGVDGKEVEVSEVGKILSAPAFDDAIDTGMVTKFIRRNRESPANRLCPTRWMK